jgi:DNA-binding transcriptional ArsR family regulator
LLSKFYYTLSPQNKIRVREVKSRLGNFCVIDVKGIRLITPCDTRVKIIRALCESDKTAEDLSNDIGASYSTVMDHMDLLEKVGLVEAYLKRGGEEYGRRRICFRLAEKAATD